MKLEPQVLGNETKRRVFGRPYLVARVVCYGMALVVALRLWQWDVEVDSAPGFGLVGAGI